MPFTELLRLLQPLTYAFVFIALYVAEQVFPARKELLDKRHDFVNVLIGLFNLLIVGIAGYFFQKFMAYINTSGFGLMNLLDLNQWLRYAIEFLLLDVFMYWWHRLNHRIPLLWRFHAFHHVDEKMNSTTAARFHVIELLFSFAARMMFFPLMGISIVGFLTYGIVFTSIVFFHHSSIRIPLFVDLIIRRILVTPHMHRIHHSIIMEETNSNFSSVFWWWDFLFGSYRKLPSGTVTFGIPTGIHKKHLS